METSTANPNIKFKKLSDAQVLEQLNNHAIDAQWDYTNAKSPKGQRDAEERLSLYGSALEMLTHKRPVININIEKLGEFMIKNGAHAPNVKEQITQILNQVVSDSARTLQV